ncbi:tetratricopeptide repeat protein [Pseudomonas sp. NA-150]|uniref:tetratricopeptide repeat protein n=1 Tax=Pseudomonas sp. NA-150 TaxID=3367525 RepID=UPI0037C72F5C
MNKWWIPAVTALALLNGCASTQRSAIPVVDSSSKVSNSERVQGNRTNNYRPNTAQQPQAVPQDSGVTVMVPGDVNSAPIQSFAAPTGAPQFNSAPIDTSGNQAPINAAPMDNAPINSAPINTSSYNAPAPVMPTGIPSNGGGLSADEELDGPVLSLLTTAQQQQAAGDLNGASSSLERAQRVAPREPQVLYRLAQVRLAQGDAPQAEQLARRGLTYANGRPSLQASLWGLIAQSREKQGDTAGAATARQKSGASS